MAHEKTDIFDIGIKSSVKIKNTKGVYSFLKDDKEAFAKYEYQPILHKLSGGILSSEELVKALMDIGITELSARLTLAQFILDYTDYIT